MTQFTTTKPTQAGVYYVRGWDKYSGRPYARAVVAVERNSDGELACNLHESTSLLDVDAWSEVKDFDPTFEWRGPMVYIPLGKGDDKRVNDDTYVNLIASCRSQIGPRRPGDDEPEDQWAWDKLTWLLEILEAEE